MNGVATQHGMFGYTSAHCLRCNRQLTNPVSIQAAKGPVCRHKQRGERNDGDGGGRGERYDYEGFHGSEAHCQVERHYNLMTGKDILILTEVEDNDGTSVTNMVEHLAARLINEYGLDPANTIIIEHYPDRGRPFYPFPETWDLVTPEFFRQSNGAWAGRVPRSADPLGDSHMWRRLTPTEVNALVGREIARSVEVVQGEGYDDTPIEF